MAFSRIILITGLLILTAVRSSATGGNYDEAPPTLDYYLQRTPAKSIGQILDGTINFPSNPQLVLNKKELIEYFFKGSSPQLVQQIDKLLAQARLGNSPPAEINFLQDLRDLGSSTAPPTEMQDYVQWRLDHLDWFVAQPLESWEEPKVHDDRIAALDAKIASSSRTMLPYWQYLKGALYYKEGNDTDSEACFDQVLKEFPESPRAETALFMKGRCLLSQSVETYRSTDTSKTKNYDALKEQAKQLFKQYLDKYPQGRYRNDVIGWLGGAEYRSANYAAALPYFIQQIDNKDHPEDLGPAITMVEKCLYHLSGDKISGLDEIANHPQIAMALAYFAVNSSAADPNDQPGTIADIRKWRQEVLPQLAAAVLAHKNLYQGTLDQNRYFAILAHAASDVGNQDQALAILNMGDKLEQNDDFAFVQALVLQRAGKLNDALVAYQDFLQKFPTSPLASGARFRLALTLHDQKKDGEALLELAAMRDNRLPLRAPAQNPSQAPGDDYTVKSQPDSAIGVDYSGASDAEIDQTMDAILNFAPLSCLETAMKGDDKEHADFRSGLRQILRERCLGNEDFAGAAKFADSSAESKVLLKLARQTNAMQHSHGSDKLLENFQLADYWASKAKMQLVLPLDSTETRSYLFHDDWLAAGLRRRTNSQALSYLDADRELESRDQWQHAIAWWLRSAEFGSQDLAPKALWNAIQARRKIVEISPYTQQRAVETNAQANVRQEYDTLIQRFPRSLEARKYAVYWNFPTADEIKKANEHYSNPTLAYKDGARENWGEAIGLGPTPEYFGNDGGWKTVCDNVGQFVKSAPLMDFKDFAATVTSLYDSAKPLAKSMDQMALVNFLQDLKDLCQVPALDPSILSRYLARRVAILRNSVHADIGSLWTENSQTTDDQIRIDIATLAKDPKTKAIADFLRFLDLAVTANHLIEVPVPGFRRDDEEVSYSSRNFSGMASQAAAFLSDFSASPKREAAFVLRLRGMDLAAFPHRIRNWVSWPEANSWDGDSTPFFYQQASFDETAFKNNLQAYYAEFPHGRYPNAVLSYRADVALMNGKWGEAMDYLLALREQKDASEFGDQIAREFATLFNKLNNGENRAQVLREILKRPGARELLQHYLKAGGNPYLKDYLLEQLKET